MVACDSAATGSKRSSASGRTAAGGGGGEMTETLIAPVQAPRILPPRPSEFFRHWFARCPSDQFLELRAIHAQDKSIRQEFFTADAVDDLIGLSCSLVEDHTATSARLPGSVRGATRPA